jgi:very-short-patch-repair endonuclease
MRRRCILGMRFRCKSSPVYGGGGPRSGGGGTVRDRERNSRIHAKSLRRSLTDAEVLLWSRLRRDSVKGWRFRRQHPIGPYIADFACTQPRVVIEVDGATHGSDAELAHDARRDAYMHRFGWRVIRLRNNDIYKNLDGIMEMIFETVPPPPAIRRAPPP